MTTHSVIVTIPEDLMEKLHGGTDGPEDAARLAQLLREQLQWPHYSVLALDHGCAVQLLYELRRGRALEGLKLVMRNLLPGWDADLPASERQRALGGADCE